MFDKAYDFPGFFFANGEAALPAFISAHLFLAASAIAFRPAALSFRLGGAALAEAGLTQLGMLSAVDPEIASPFFRPDPGGLPRRFTEPCNASIAP